MFTTLKALFINLPIFNTILLANYNLWPSIRTLLNQIRRKNQLVHKQVKYFVVSVCRDTTINLTNFIIHYIMYMLYHPLQHPVLYMMNLAFF